MGFLVWLGLVLVLVALLIFSVGLVFGQDIDRNASCLYQEFPYNVICAQYQRDQMFKEFIDSLREGNNGK